VFFVSFCFRELKQIFGNVGGLEVDMGDFGEAVVGEAFYADETLVDVARGDAAAVGGLARN
jgi:hypothetical protein